MTKEDMDFLCSVGGMHARLRVLFDELGVTEEEMRAREKFLLDALRKELDVQIAGVAEEVNEVRAECKHLQKDIACMQSAMAEDQSGSCDIKIPLRTCRNTLQMAHHSIKKSYDARTKEAEELLQHLREQQEMIGDAAVPELRLTVDFMIDLHAKVDMCAEEIQTREASVQDVCKEILQMNSELGEESQPTITNSRDNVRAIGLKQRDLERLRKQRDDLFERKIKRSALVEAYKRSICDLWEKLHLDEEVCQEFLQRNSELSSVVVHSLQEELSRLEELKRQSVHIFITHARKDLTDLWARLYFSDNEISKFAPASTNTYNEAVLCAHEQEVQRLQGLVCERTPILKLIQRHDDLLREQRDLEILSQDSSRLMNRRANQRHNLLEEERVRKRLARELPRTEVLLEQLLVQWEKEHELFLVHGEHHLSHVRNQIATRAEGGLKKPNPHTPRQPSALAPISINTRGSPSRSPNRPKSNKSVKKSLIRPFTPKPQRYARAEKKNVKPPTPRRSTQALAYINAKSESIQRAHAIEKQTLGVLQDNMGDSNMQKLRLESISPTPPAHDGLTSSPLQLITTRDGQSGFCLGGGGS